MAKVRNSVESFPDRWRKSLLISGQSRRNKARLWCVQATYRSIMKPSVTYSRQREQVYKSEKMQKEVSL